jgi:hypothetical protein
MDSNDSSQRNFAKSKFVNLAGTTGWMIHRIKMPGRRKAARLSASSKNLK